MTNLQGNIFSGEFTEVKYDPKTKKPKKLWLGLYFAPPGTGPQNETCGSCGHRVKKQVCGTYQKCGLMKRGWTGGSGTDIKCKAPACRGWEKGEAKILTPWK